MSELGQRKLKNIFINPGAQFRLFLPYIVLMSLASILINVLLYATAGELFLMIPDMTPALSSKISDLALRGGLIGAAGLSIMAVLGFILSSVLSHRFLGPLVPIERFIRGLSEGNYDQVLTLRKTDELHGLANELNNLATKLREQAPAAHANLSANATGEKG